jgi:hypothetical protein
MDILNAQRHGLNIAVGATLGRAQPDRRQGQRVEGGRRRTVAARQLQQRHVDGDKRDDQPRCRRSHHPVLLRSKRANTSPHSVRCAWAATEASIRWPAII